MLRKTKMAHATAQHGLFMTTVVRNENSRSDTLGCLSIALKDVCQEPSVTAITCAYRRSLAIYADAAARARDYLKRAINMPYLNALAFTSWINMAYKDTPLNKDSAMLRQVFSCLILLPED